MTVSSSSLGSRVPAKNTSTDLVAVAERLKSRVKRLRFGEPVAYVYNPLEYAWPVARAYFERYGRGPKEVLLLGMNPGPFGMGQTGVPFGEVAAVRDYLRLQGDITPPRRFHEKRPVLGFACTRSEVSGQRLWGAFARRYPAADDFFARAFVLNYCPLLFLGESGANLTPDKLVKDERVALEAICDDALAETIALLEPRHLVGVGVYAAKRAAIVTGRADVITMPHPSPASPTANKGWEQAAQKALVDAGLTDLL
ncbi:MAG: single-stranded DNA-binding protein [Labilithrix sp.]|nr:single-stranded DNA-binding protein [Labilithrix sp.]